MNQATQDGDWDLKADVAYVRALAEEGRQAPLLGAPFHVWWAIWTGLALSIHGATVQGLTPWGPQYLWGLWVSYGVLGGLVSGLILPQFVIEKPGAGAFGNRAERWVWPSAMGGLGALAVGILIAVATGRAPLIMVDLIIPAAFAGYATAFMSTALLSGVQWLRIPAVICYAAALIAPSFVGTSMLYFGAAASLLTVGVTVGVVMARQEPTTTV